MEGELHLYRHTVGLLGWLQHAYWISCIYFGVHCHAPVSGVPLLAVVKVLYWPYHAHSHSSYARTWNYGECTEMPASALGNNTVVIGYPEPASKNCAEGFAL